MFALPVKLNGTESGPLKFSASAAARSVTRMLVIPEKVICFPFWLATIFEPEVARFTAPEGSRKISRVDPDWAAKLLTVTVEAPETAPETAWTVVAPPGQRGGE